MSTQTQQIPADWKTELQKETALVAYLDLSNMFHWQKVLRWRFRLEDVVLELFAVPGMKEVRVYYGLDERNLNRSQGFHKRIRKTGAILRSKTVKYIKRIISGLQSVYKFWPLLQRQEKSPLQRKSHHKWRDRVNSKK